MRKTEGLLAPSSILPLRGGGWTTKMLYGLAADDTPCPDVQRSPHLNPPPVGEEAGRGPLRGRPNEAPCEEEAGRETLDAA